MPGSYFLLTFTLPFDLRELAWRHQRMFYAVLFDCAWDTLSTFSRNDKQLQGAPGAVAVLHTHSRRLEFHPHVHLAMPAAALDTEQRLWCTKRRGKGNGYLFNTRALAKVFRAKVLAALGREGMTLPPCVAEKWVVHCKGVGGWRQGPGLSGPISVSRRDSGKGHPLLRERAGPLSLSRRQNQENGATHGEPGGFPALAARAAQGLSPRAQLWLSASQ